MVRAKGVCRLGLAAVTGKDGRIYTIGGATQCHANLLASARITPWGHPARRPAQSTPGPPAQIPQGSCSDTRTVRAFNSRTKKWRGLAPLPVNCLLPAAALAPDGRIDVFGCGDDSPQTSGGSVEVYDPKKNSWTKLAGEPSPRLLGFAAAAERDGRIDLIGGCMVTDKTYYGFASYCGDPSRVDAYDSRTNTWTKLGVTLNWRQALAATAGPNGEVYAVGGAGYGNGTMLEVIRRGSR